MNSKIEKKHFVVFLSPGTLVSEVSERPIDNWDVREAFMMSKKIKERHGATPYGFYFETRLCAPPISDGAGGTLNVEAKTVKTSGTHFFGKLETLDEVEARNLPDEMILRSNMEGNDWPIVAVTTEGYKSTHPFEQNDFLVSQGTIAERGDDPKHIAYRDECMRRKKAAAKARERAEKWVNRA